MVMGKQEIFDKVSKHLLKQGRRAFDTKQQKCMYLTKSGLKCAIGCLIKEECYSEELEGLTVDRQAVKHAVKLSGVSVSGDSMRLLSRLQGIHDTLPPNTWREELAEAALDYKLKFMASK